MSKSGVKRSPGIQPFNLLLSIFRKMAMFSKIICLTIEFRFGVCLHTFVHVDKL